jgi:hypothetical protein
MSFKMWCVWAIVLIIQNFAFTFVSRARNSGSIYRHMVASIFSNGVWFLSQIIIFSQMFAMMTGKYGLKTAIFVGAYYTVFTMAGSLLAHYFSLLNEKGKGAVGANKKYHQVTAEEWGELKQIIATRKPPYVPTNEGGARVHPDSCLHYPAQSRCVA